MREAAITFLLILVLASLTSLTGAPFPRHVNPSEVTEERPRIDLLLLYSSIGGYAMQLNFTEAFKVLQDLKYAYFPKDLKYLLERFNSLLNETLKGMNNTKHHLSLCKIFLRDSNIPLAEKSLSNAWRSLAESRASYFTLKDSSRELSRRVPAGPIHKAVSNIEEGISRLEREAEDLNSTLNGLKPKLSNVRLEISVKPRYLIFGQNFSVTGSLTAEDGHPLDGRRIILHVGKESYSLETSTDGSYFTTCYAKEYTPLKVFAEYIPYGEDIGKYSYGISNVILVNVTYYVPQLNLTLSKDRLLPEETLTIWVNTLPKIALQINTPLGKVSALTDEKGSYTYNLTVPSSIKEGSYTISVSTFPSGVFSSARASRNFRVYKLKTDHSLYVPRIVFTGIPFTIKATANTNSTITLTLKELGMTYSSHGLHSSRIVTLPLTFLSESVTISISITPDSPTYRSVHETSKVTVINSFAIFVPAALLLLISTRLLKSRIETQAARKPPEKIEIMMEHKPQSGVQALFLQLTALLERFSGIIMKPSDTLREYHSKIESKLHAKFKDAVRRIFDLYEQFLYGKPRGELREHLTQAISKLLEGFRKVLKA